MNRRSLLKLLTGGAALSVLPRAAVTAPPVEPEKLGDPLRYGGEYATYEFDSSDEFQPMAFETEYRCSVGSLVVNRGDRRLYVYNGATWERI